MGTFDDLIKQVDAFIRKYYKNLMLRGFLLFLITFFISFFTVVGLEYLGRFNSLIRAVLFYLFLGVNVYVLVSFILLPLSKLFSFGKRINRFQAAKIIGQFFPQVNDRLLNTLQLNSSSAIVSQANIDLVQASIAQNAKKLTVFQFPSAIRYSENKRYFRYLIPLIVLLILIGYLLPAFFKDGTQRLVNYNQVYEIPAPFTFELLTQDLQIETGSSVTIAVKVVPKEGGEIPDRIYLESSEGRFLMQKSAKNEASFVLQKPTKPVQFNFYSNGFSSNSYLIDVVGKASLSNFTAELHFPRYLNMPQQVISNVGDLIVPEGTSIKWSGRVKNTKSLGISTQDSLYTTTGSSFEFSATFNQTDELNFILENHTLQKKDTINYAVEVIKDAFPEIVIDEVKDSLRPSVVRFTGFVADDHGLRNVVFTYEITRKDGTKVTKEQTVPGISGTRSSISMSFDISQLSLQLDDIVSYFFTVYDNDGVNGSKSVRSHIFQYKVPSSKELNEKRTNDKEKAKDELKQLINESKQFNEQLKSLQLDLLNTQQPSWKELKQVEQLQEQRSSLQERIQKLNEQLKDSFEEKKNLSPVEEELMEKQALLEELLEEVMDDELMEMLKKLEEMLKNQNMEGMQELFEDAEMDAKDMDKQMDKTLEMLKRMDVDERMENIENTLDELAAEQEALKEQLENNEITSEEAKELQDELNKAFEEVEEAIDELIEKNEELKRPLDLDAFEEDREEIKEEMEKASESLDKDKKESAKEEQQKASDKMQEMSTKMNAMKQESKQQQQQEDMEALRRLLSNLLHLSFDQETNLEQFKSVTIYDPSFIALGKEQRSIIDNTKPVEDSLRALADRIPKLSTFIIGELKIINQQFRNLIDDIDERRKRDLEVKQQTAMTSFNNLALFLNESLQSMQEEMQGDMQGDGSCDNPGGKGKGKEGDELQNMKDMLKKQLEQMEKGQQPGGQKPGDKDGLKLPFGSKEAAQMAAQQQAMRKKLEQMREELNKEGEGKGNELNDLLKELEEQQKNLINKKWDEELINRQRELLTRLLESEKALEERGWDEERERSIGKDEDFGNQIEFLEYKKEKEKQIELLRTLDPNFSKYYRDRANEYFNILYK